MALATVKFQAALSWIFLGENLVLTPRKTADRLACGH
jgi:hypothetical protein